MSVITKASYFNHSEFVFNKILFEPAVANAIDDESAVFDTDNLVAKTFAQTQPYLAGFSATGSSFYIDVGQFVNNNVGVLVGFRIKVVAKKGSENVYKTYDIVDWCKLTGDEFIFNATIYKSAVSGNPFASNDDFIGNTNYAPAWAQSPKTVSVTINGSSSNLFNNTSRYPGIIDVYGNIAPLKGSFVMEMGHSYSGVYRNQITFTSITKDGNSVSFEWGAF